MKSQLILATIRNGSCFCTANRDSRGEQHINTMKSFVLAGLVLLLLGLAACGGGGGGDNQAVAGQFSDNARLAGINLSVGSLDQLFQSSQTSYTATVSYLVASISITAWTEDEQASMTVNGAATGSGSASAMIALGAGAATTITLSVTAEDGSSTRDYTVTVQRQSLQTFAQQAYAKASNTGATDYFGYSVSLSGDTLAVGAYGEASAATGVNGDQADNSAPASGAVYVFTRNNGV
jgi:hypothetical protein